MKSKFLVSAFSALAAGSLFAADDAKSRVDAFLANEFAEGNLKCMSCAYEQHGETRYRYVTAKGWDGFDADTPVHVASITKVFTATLLLQLAEEGKLSLNDYVQKYIPEFKGQYVPILNLMTHTSGWRNQTGHVAKSVDPKRHDEFYATMHRIRARRREAGEGAWAMNPRSRILSPSDAPMSAAGVNRRKE